MTHTRIVRQWSREAAAVRQRKRRLWFGLAAVAVLTATAVAPTLALDGASSVLANLDEASVVFDDTSTESALNPDEGGGDNGGNGDNGDAAYVPTPSLTATWAVPASPIAPGERVTGEATIDLVGIEAPVNGAEPQYATFTVAGGTIVSIPAGCDEGSTLVDGLLHCEIPNDAFGARLRVMFQAQATGAAAASQMSAVVALNGYTVELPSVSVRPLLIDDDGPVEQEPVLSASWLVPATPIVSGRTTTGEIAVVLHGVGAGADPLYVLVDVTGGEVASIPPACVAGSALSAGVLRCVIPDSALGNVFRTGFIARSAFSALPGEMTATVALGD